jgi:hypothetical protein
MFNSFFFLNRALCEIMSKKYGGARGATNEGTIWRIRVPCWINKTTHERACAHTHAHGHPHTYTHTHTHTRACTHKYVILTAFPRQQ